MKPMQPTVKAKKKLPFPMVLTVHLSILILLALLFAALLLRADKASAAAAAATTTTRTQNIDSRKLLCPDADIWGEKLINGICWSCLFPVRLLGATILPRSPSTDDVPDGAADETICACTSGDDPIPKPGIAAGLWAPARLVEVVRRPYCSPTLGGVTLQDSVRLFGGHKEEGGDTADKTFYNYHYYAFPLYEMLELFIQSHCNAGGYTSMDLLYLSELDPLWNDDELSFFINPEAAVFANPVAMAACTADCATTSLRKPMESLFWCAGCWGNLYPFTGNIASDASAPRDTSLLAARLIAGLHRRGLAWKTIGNDALCGGTIYPMLPKQQYRLSTLFPLAEAGTTIPGTDAAKSCCHYIGETPFKWGEWRTVPGTGEDYVYMVWRYTDCCLL